MQVQNVSAQPARILPTTPRSQVADIEMGTLPPAPLATAPRTAPTAPSETYVTHPRVKVWAPANAFIGAIAGAAGCAIYNTNWQAKVENMDLCDTPGPDCLPTPSQPVFPYIALMTTLPVGLGLLTILYYKACGKLTISQGVADAMARRRDERSRTHFAPGYFSNGG